LFGMFFGGIFNDGTKMVISERCFQTMPLKGNFMKNFDLDLYEKMCETMFRDVSEWREMWNRCHEEYQKCASHFSGSFRVWYEKGYFLIHVGCLAFVDHMLSQTEKIVAAHEKNMLRLGSRGAVEVSLFHAARGE